MSQDDTIGNAVGAGMAAGLAVGIRMQQQRAIDSWEDYSRGLERDILHLRAQVSKKQARISSLEETLEKKSAREAKLADELKTVKEHFELYSGLLEFVEGEARRLKKEVIHASGEAKVTHALYEQLLTEVNEISDPRLFESLDPYKRREFIEGEFKAFRESGITNYEVKLTAPNKQNQSKNIDLLIAQAVKLKARNELIRFLNVCAREVMDTLPGLSPEQSETPLAYYESLVAKIKDASDPAKYAALDPVAVLTDAQNDWKKYQTQ